MSRTQKLLWSLLTVVVMGSLATFGTFSAFSHTTSNSGNAFDAGTVNLSDNDLDSALYTRTNSKPGETEESCIRVSYGGTLDANVRLYMAQNINPEIGDQVTLRVDKGTSTNATPANCGDFAQQGASLYTGTLDDFQAAHSSYATGLVAFPGAATKWVANDALYYRITVTLTDDADVNDANRGAASGYVAGSAGYQSGTHTYTWEARNQ